MGEIPLPGRFIVKFFSVKMSPLKIFFFATMDGLAINIFFFSLLDINFFLFLNFSQYF